jgi:5-methylcytosine-specific restriction endonuclease McrA
MKRNYYDRKYRKNRAICIKQNPTCVRCGMELAGQMTADHIVPLSMNGSNDLSNLQTMCKPCNYGLGNKTGSKRVRMTRLNTRWVNN